MFYTNSYFCEKKNSNAIFQEKKRTQKFIPPPLVFSFKDLENKKCVHGLQVEFRRKPLLSFRKQALIIGMGQTQRDANKKEECRKGVTSDSKRHGGNKK